MLGGRSLLLDPVEFAKGVIKHGNKHGLTTAYCILQKTFELFSKLLMKINCYRTKDTSFSV